MSKGNLQKAGEMVRTAINWLRIRTTGGLLYMGADKSLARPGSKQANISVRMA